MILDVQDRNRGFGGRAPATNGFYKNTHFSRLFYGKRTSWYQQSLQKLQKYFSSPCLKAEAGLKQMKGGCNHY